MADVLDVAAVGRVRVLTLARPERRNALDDALVAAARRAIEDARQDEGTGAIVLTGRPPAFCAGGDLGDVPDGADATALATRHRDFVALADALRTLPKPVVAAVNGAAVGAGASLALASDHVVIAHGAVLQLPFLSVGLPPDLLSVVTLTNRAGTAAAADLLYSGRAVSGEEAVRLRLADEVAHDGDVVQVAVAAATRLAELPGAAFGTTKMLLRMAAELGDRLVDIEPYLVGGAAASDDFATRSARFRR